MPMLRTMLALIALPASLAAQSLSLDDAIGSAVRREGVARNAALDVTRADAAAAQARAGLLPSAGLRASAVRRTVNPDAFGILSLPARATDPFTVYDARASARVPIIDFAALGRWRAARRDVEVISAESDRAVAAAAFEGAVAYLRVAHAEALLNATRHDLTLARDLLVISSDRVEAGVAPHIDRTRSRARVAESEALIAAGTADVDRARIALEFALDNASDARLPLTDSLEQLASIDSLDEASAVALARAQRAEVTAATARVLSARQRLRAVGAEWIPSLNLQGDIGSIGRSRDAMVTTWQLGIEVAVPLLDGLSRQARSAGASAALEQAELSRREVLRAIDLEVRAAMAGIDALGAQVDAARTQVELGATEVEQARTRFSAGVAGNGDVVTALASLSRARVSLTNALAARAMARLAVASATGSLSRQ